MNPRERNLIVGLLAVIVLGGGAFGGYTFVYSPLDETNVAIKQLEDEINGDGDKQGLSDRVVAMKKSVAQAAVVKRQSLPPDINDAKKQYMLLLERLLQQAKVEHYSIPNATLLDSRAPATPDLGNKKPAFTRLMFRVDMSKADIWQVTDFLTEFYNLDLLHQITEMTITRENKPTDVRNGLNVRLAIEAIILDGAETKFSLFPVTIANKANSSVELTSSGEAVAAIGGGRAVQAVAAHPELVRRVTASTNTPVLASRPRDYSLIPLRDIFYGVIPKEREGYPP